MAYSEIRKVFKTKHIRLDKYNIVFYYKTISFKLTLAEGEDVVLNERRAQILEEVNRRKTVAFSELITMFPNVSEMTLRKDLKCLDAQGRLVRVHGGARSLETVLGADTPLLQRLCENIELKQEIANKARKLVKPGMTIFLDSGSTMTQLAKLFPDVPCQVLTGGISCVQELCKLTQINITMLGGRVNKGSASVRDARLANELREMYFDIAFIGVNGLSKENKFSCRSADRVYMEKTAISRASHVVVLMDSTKIGKISPYSICQINAIDTIVSDSYMEDSVRHMLQSEGIEVL